MARKKRRSRTGEKCLAPGCERNAISRGLCWACYQTATRKITAGETTWAALVEAGLALESYPTNRSNANPLGVAIAALPPSSNPAQSK